MFAIRLMTTVGITVFLLLPAFIFIYILACATVGAVAGAQAAASMSADHSHQYTSSDFQQAGADAGRDAVASHIALIMAISALLAMTSSFLVGALLSFTGLLPWCRAKPAQTIRY